MLSSNFHFYPLLGCFSTTLRHFYPVFFLNYQILEIVVKPTNSRFTDSVGSPDPLLPVGFVSIQTFKVWGL